MHFDDDAWVIDGLKEFGFDETCVVMLDYILIVDVEFIIEHFIIGVQDDLVIDVVDRVIDGYVNGEVDTFRILNVSDVFILGVAYDDDDDDDDDDCGDDCDDDDDAVHDLIGDPENVNTIYY